MEVVVLCAVEGPGNGAARIAIAALRRVIHVTTVVTCGMIPRQITFRPGWCPASSPGLGRGVHSRGKQGYPCLCTLLFPSLASEEHGSAGCILTERMDLC